MTEEKDYIEVGLKEILVVISLFLLITSLFSIGFYIGERHSCKLKAERMSIDWDFGFFMGCMYNIDGNWIDSNNYQVHTHTNEGVR